MITPANEIRSTSPVSRLWASFTSLVTLVLAGVCPSLVLSLVRVCLNIPVPDWIDCGI